MPSAASGLAATAVSRDSICSDGAEAAVNCGVVSGTVFLPWEFTGSPHQAAHINPGCASGVDGTRPVRFPGRVKVGWVA
jgi:hypothetical protein